MKKHLLFSFLIVCLSAVAYAQPAGWRYETPISVTNTSGQLITGYSLGITVNTQALISINHMKANGADIRFGTPCTGTRLFNYYIDSGINTATTLIYVLIDSLKPNSTRTIWMFYGNDTSTVSTSGYAALAGPYTMFNNQTISGGFSTYNYSSSNDVNGGTYFQPNEQLLVVALGVFVNSSGSRVAQLSSYPTGPTTGTIIAKKTFASTSYAAWTFVNLDTPKVISTAYPYSVSSITPYYYPSYNYAYYYLGSIPATVASQVNVLGYAYGYPAAGVTNIAPQGYPSNLLYGYSDIKFYALPAPNSYVSYLYDTSINGSVFIDPVNTLVCPGTTATFSAKAGGVAPTYQWQVNTGNGWSNLNTSGIYTGVNLPMLNIAGVTTAMNGYQYRAYMTSSCGTGYGNPATLNVNTAPIQTPVSNIAGPNPACQYTNATYTISTNVLSGTYAWFKNGVNTGATGATYSFAPAQGDQVYAVVTTPNNASIACYNLPIAVTNAITINIGRDFAPIDSVAPSSNNNCAGAMVDLNTYSNVVGGSYQWYVNGQPVAGANASVFTYAPNNGDQVTETINVPSNGCYNINTVTSQPVVLTTLYSIIPNIQVVGPTTAYENQQITVAANVTNYGSGYTIEWRNQGVPFDTTVNVNSILFTKSMKPTVDRITARITPVSPSNGTCYAPETSQNELIIDFTPFNVGVGNVVNNNGITAYPNPFTNSVHVNGMKAGDHVMVYDMTGRQVTTIYEAAAASEEYTPEGLASGHYILHVTDSEGNTKANISLSKL